MANGSERGAPALESLSALSDGECDVSAVAWACSAWRDDVGVRSSWHAYQLIGDVLRSEDLACHPSHDAAFLAAVRERLAREPVVLAPEAASPMPETRSVHSNAVRGARWSWKAPSAVAAGFVLVAGALVATRTPSPGVPAAPAAPTLAAAPALPPVAVPALAAAEPTFAPRRAGGDNKFVRDVRLDRYLAAHQQFAGTTALGVPSGFLRNAAAEAPGR